MPSVQTRESLRGRLKEIVIRVTGKEDIRLSDDTNFVADLHMPWFQVLNDLLDAVAERLGADIWNLDPEELTVGVLLDLIPADRIESSHPSS